MTPLELWLQTTTEALIGTLRKDCEPDWGEAFGLDHEAEARAIKAYASDWNLHELRVAIGLVQARALECRAMAAMLTINREMLVGRVAPDLRLAMGLAIRNISGNFMDRSHELEKIGMEMANKMTMVPSEATPAPVIADPEPGALIQ